VIPIRDENPTYSTPVVTIALIALNIVVFFTEPIFRSGTAGQIEQARYFECHAAIPFEVTHGERVGDALAKGRRFDTQLDNAFAVLELRSCPRKSVWLSVVTSMFLHGSILHIGFNMLFLWVFGNNVEDRLGRLKYILFYLACGAAAAYAQSYVFPNSAQPLIGASGAIAGVLGAYLLMFPRARVTNVVFILIIPFLFELPAAIVLGVWFLLQIFQGVGSVTGSGGVAYMAHVGGFLAGMLLLLVFRPRPAPRPPVVPLPY
jgi:membrane associated rhomboid family serine protease